MKFNRVLTLLALWLVVISRHGAAKAGTSSLKPPAQEDGGFNALHRTSGDCISRPTAGLCVQVRGLQVIDSRVVRKGV